MVANKNTNEAFAAKLTDVALGVILEHGVQTPSVDVEIDLWQQLGQLVGGQPVRCQTLASLADGAYHVGLEHGARGNFLDLEVNLWQAFQAAAAGVCPEPAALA